MSEKMIDDMKKAMQSRRFTLRKLVWYVLFLLIGLVFVFFGFANQQMGTTGGHAAIVNDSVVTVAELDREQRRVEAMYRQFLGANMDFSSQRQLLMQEAIQSLVNQRLISQAAQRAGFLVSDKEVIDSIIRDYPIFQVNGVFQRNLYYDTLQSNRMTPVEFESVIRSGIEGQRSRLAFEAAGIPNALEREKQKTLKETQLILSYVKISPKELEKTMKVSREDVQKALADEAFAKRAEEVFKATQNLYDKPEQVRAQHILIRVNAADATSEAKALEKIKKLKKEAESKDFGALAAQHSEDPGSKTKKGDLGFFGRGQMAPEFESAAFSMTAGQVSEPVKTQFGYHLIKLNEKKPQVRAQFADHKQEIAQTLLARDQVSKWQTQAREAVSKGEESDWLKTTGLSWKDTPAFDLGADSIPELSPQVFEQIDQVLQAKSKAQLIQDNETVYIVKLKESKKAPAPSASILDMESQSRAQEMFSSWLDQYRRAVKIEINSEITKMKQ